VGLFGFPGDGTGFHMRLMSSFSHLVAASTTATTAKATSSGSSSEFFLVIIVLFAVMYFVLLRPNRRRQQQALRARSAYDLGDEVIAGGMVGRVVRMGDGEVDIEVSDGVVIQFMPQAVQLRSAYMAGPRGGLGGARGGMGGMGGGMGGASGRAAASSATGGSATDASGTVTGARSRSVRRRATASGTWPGPDDTPGAGNDIQLDGGTGTDGGTGASDGGAAPSSGDS
jgi:preprotein translocase subunit YajC